MDLDTFRDRIEWHHAANKRRYEAPAGPWRLIRIDPASVDRWNNGLRLNWGLGRVQGGDWDSTENTGSLAETPFFRGLRQRFTEGCDWEETALYDLARSQFERGQSARGYRDLETYRAERCAYIDDLYERIEREGYRPNREADHDNPAAERNRYEDAYAHHLEPLIAIGRTGGMYLTEGYHRVAIAQILDLESIPVQVLCRHVEWQRVRDRLATTPSTPPDIGRHVGHPDLADINRDTPAE